MKTVVSAPRTSASGRRAATHSAFSAALCATMCRGSADGVLELGDLATTTSKGCPAGRAAAGAAATPTRGSMEGRGHRKGPLARVKAGLASPCARPLRFVAGPKLAMVHVASRHASRPRPDQLNRRRPPGNRRRILDAYSTLVAKGAQLVIFPSWSSADTRPATSSSSAASFPTSRIPCADRRGDRRSPGNRRHGRDQHLGRPAGRFTTRRPSAPGEGRLGAHKCLLPTYDVFDEDRYFEPVCKPTVVPTGSGGSG